MARAARLWSWIRNAYDRLVVGRRIVTVLVVLYVAAAAIAAWRVVKPRSVSDAEVHLDATRVLRRNHRITAADLREPEGLPGHVRWRLPDRKRLEGKYLTHEVRRGEPVSEGDVADWPDLDPGPNSFPMPFPADDLIDAGSYADVCAASGGCSVTRVPVIAVLCRTAGSCQAIIAVPRIRAEDVSAAAKTEKLQLRLVAL